VKNHFSKNKMLLKAACDSFEAEYDIEGVNKSA
jgi:hypothetical protein